MATWQGYDVQHLVAPLSTAGAHDLMAFLDHKGPPWVDDIRRRARGELPGADDHFFVALDGQRLVGHVWYSVAHRDPRLGLIGHVFTDPACRRRGIAARLLEEAIAQFRRGGGVLLQLFTSTPFSIPFYEKFGFENLFSQPVLHDRDWYMRSPAGSGQSLPAWLDSPRVAIRPLAPGELPQYCLLYNAQHDHVLKDRAQQIGLGLEAELTFIRTTGALAEGRGACWVLDNGQTLVGAATLMPSAFSHQSHIALFDLYVLEPAGQHAAALAARCLRARDELGIERVYGLAVDASKRRLFQQLGFTSRGLLPGHYKVAEQRHDCELFECGQ
jgi:N-acetylglutamate synthase-like GNAT family acetyltransferase